MSTPLETSGATPQKQPKYVPIFLDRAFTGLYTQRAVLHDPSDVYTARFYGGRPDALLTGRNIELTNRLTLQRRPGLVPFQNIGSGDGATYPTVPIRAFSFQLANGAIQVIIDTDTSGPLSITSSGNASGGLTAYVGTFPGGANNGYAGLSFVVSGFVQNPTNNGTFVCTASTTTTLTLQNSAGIFEIATASAVTAGGVYVDNQNGTNKLLWAKSPGAGQSQFIAVAGVLYFGNGVDTKKYTPLNPNGLIWNWGITAPTNQPTVTPITSGAASTTWQASTVFSTMGLTLDSNVPQKVWQVIGTNADGSNAANPQFGTTGTGEPNWPTVEGNTVVDGSVTWQNAGDINHDWASNTFFTDIGFFGNTPPPNFSRPAAFTNMGLKVLYGNFRNSGSLGNTGSNEPHFNGAYPGPSGGYFDNNCHWFAIGAYSTTAQMKAMRWKPSTAYAGWHAGGTTNTVNGQPDFIVTNNLPAPAGNPVYLFIPIIGGTSSSGYQPFPASAGVRTTVSDGQIQWQCLGNATWQPNTPYVPWTAPGITFGCIFDGANFQVCTQIKGSGLSGSTKPAFASGYGSQTQDGGITWICVGQSVAWAASQIWNLPNNGFQPPSSAQGFGGSQVNAANNFVQAVIQSGTSAGSGPPSFATPSSNPPTTVDGTITWQAIGAVQSNSLTIKFGLAYGFSYKARPVTDFYSPLPLGGGNVPPGSVILGPPSGSETNAISSASPVNQLVGANSGAVFTISGAYSPDPQVDTIVIWRSADTASGSGNMFELTEIPNIPSQAGVSQWVFQDFLPSTATGSFPGLNVLLPAPVNGVNNPPPSTFLPMVFNYQRIWGANGQQVNFSGGPDTNVGNPNEAFNAADELPFLAPVVRLVKMSQGIATFLTNSIEMIGGGPATATFFSVQMAAGIGLLNYNACDVFAGEVYFFANDNSFRVLTPALNISNFGFPLGDQFANIPTTGIKDTTWNPNKVYVAVHQNGIDNCIFVADGSTGWYRLNPHQVPGAAQGPEPIWSPFAAITNGCRLVQSVETTPGIKQLLVGQTLPGEEILTRSLTTFTDDGVPYDAFFVMGSITLAHPGQIALLKFLEFDFSGNNFQPSISYLLNEISGTFTSFVNGANGVPQFDPPSIYGKTLSPSSYSPNRYYFASNASLAKCRHMQVMVDYGATSNGDELYTMTIFGRLMVET